MFRHKSSLSKGDTMTLEEFNSKYVYKTDKDKFGFIEVWEIPKLQDGKYYGDCESYCLFLKKNVPEFENWDLYFCKINGNGHCVLYKDGNIIDCNVRSIANFNSYCEIYKVSEFSKYNRFTVVSKVLVSKVLLWFRSLKG